MPEIKNKQSLFKLNENKILRIFAILPMIVTIILLPRMDAKMPSHYNSDGTVDDWSSKYHFLILPVIILIIWLIVEVVLMIFNSKSHGQLDNRMSLQMQTYSVYVYLAANVIIITLGFMHYYMMYMSIVENNRIH